MSLTLEKLDIEALTVEERLELIEKLWDSLNRGGSVASSPDWHLQVVTRRRSELDADPGSAIPLEEVRRRLTEAL
jgi:putative addiction module component (TIGR02574 family)